MNFARIVDGVAVDVCADPQGSFHPSLAEQFASVPDNVTQGSRLGEDGHWTIYVRPAAPPAPPPAGARRITRLAFLSRFTDAEAIAFDLASMGSTPEAAGLRRYMSKINAATFVDLDSADTRAGVIALEAATLLADGRATEILDAPVIDSEAYQGA